MGPSPTTYLVFSLFATLSALGIVVCAIVGTFYIRHRHLRLVKMSSPRVNLISIAGAALIFLACGIHNITFFILNRPHTALAAYKVSVWLGSCGFTIFFGAILLKTWRVYRIFESTGTKRPVIRDQHLITGVFLLLATDIVLLLVWQSVDDITLGQSLQQGSNATAYQWSSKSISSSFPFTCSHLTLWLTILFLWKAFLVCLGSYLSWAVRLVTVPALGDGPVLMLCSYVALLSTAVAVVLLALTAKSTDSFVTVIQTWLISGTTISLLVSHAAKIFSLLSSHDLSKMAFARNASQNNYECIEEELYSLTVENNQLKKELIQREELIRELQGRSKAKFDSMSDLSSKAGEEEAPPVTEATLAADSAALLETAADVEPPLTPSSAAPDDATPPGGGSPSPEPDRAPRMDVTSAVGDAATAKTPDDDEQEEVVVEEMEMSPSDSPSREQDPLVVRYPTITKVVTTTKRTVPKDGSRRAVTVTRKTTTTTTTRCRRRSILRSASRRQAQDAVSRSRVLRYELAQTIAESYNLSKDGDTLSYVSHCLSPSLMDEALRRARDHGINVPERPQCLLPPDAGADEELQIEDLGPCDDELDLEDGLVLVNDRLHSPSSGGERLSVTPIDPLSEQASPRLNSGGKSWKKRFSQRFLADSFLSPTPHRLPHPAGTRGGPLQPGSNAESPEEAPRELC